MIYSETFFSSSFSFFYALLQCFHTITLPSTESSGTLRKAKKKKRIQNRKKVKYTKTENERESTKISQTSCNNLLEQADLLEASHLSTKSYSTLVSFGHLSKWILQNFTPKNSFSSRLNCFSELHLALAHGLHNFVFVCFIEMNLLKIPKREGERETRKFHQKPKWFRFQVKIASKYENSI